MNKAVVLGLRWTCVLTLAQEGKTSSVILEKQVMLPIKTERLGPNNVECFHKTFHLKENHSQAENNPLVFTALDVSSKYFPRSGTVTLGEITNKRPVGNL